MPRTQLGVNQAGVLKALRQFGSWSETGWGHGWVWDSASNTKAILDSLVRRGAVTKDEKGVYRPRSR